MQPPPLPEIVNGEPLYIVERVLSHRLRRQKMELLVKWQGYTQEHNSWEPAEAILENCEDLVSAYWSQSEARSEGSARKRRAGRPTQ